MCSNKGNHWRAKWKESRAHGRGHRGPGNIIGFLVRAFMLKILWNILVPAIFGGPIIGFLQAVGLLLLGKIITGGPRGHCGKGRGREWKMKMKKKMEKMSPEERREFKDKMMGWEVNIIEVEDEDSEESEEEEDNKGKKK